MRAELESLLAADSRAASFLDRAAIGPPSDSVASRIAESLPPGTMLGAYRIGALLGSGGMGEVYRANDPRLGRDLAIKILSPELWNSRRALHRFEREARAASALNHPAIVQIYEIATATIERGGMTEEVPYIAMELVDGQTLRERLNGGAALRDVLGWLIAAGRGLARAHAAGIVHRDLKPENIMVTAEDFPKLLDFGLAKLIEPDADLAASATREGVVMGTAGYMSPEQVQGKTIDHRSDIFSFGCILHEAISGRAPFTTNSLIDTLHDIVHRPAPPMRRDGRVASRALQSIVDRCLAKSPGDRYSSIDDVANELAAVVAANDFQGGRSWNRYAAAAAVAGAIVVSIAYGWRLLPRDAAPARQQTAARRTVGIAPFVAASASDSYLAEGLAERAADHLGRAPGLVVVPAAAVKQALARGSRETVASTLGVNSLVTGRLQRTGDRLRVTLNVFDLDTGRHRLTTLERRIDEIPALQQDIVNSLAGTFNLAAGDVSNRALIRNTTTNTQAYDHFLRGRAEWNRWSEAGFAKAIEHFETALMHDPLFANAYAGISDCYTQMAMYLFMAPAEAWPRAKAAALRAISLDPNLGEAHMSLGVVQTWHDWDFAAAEESYRRAVALSPRSPEVRLAYGFHLAVVGRLKEANKEMERARDLNPVSPIAGLAVVESLMMLEDRNRFLAEARRLSEMNPEMSNAHFLYAIALETNGEPERAFREWMRFEELSGVSKEALAELELAFRRGGLRAYWAAAAARYQRDPAKVGLERAQAWAFAGDRERALAAIEQGVARHEAFALWARTYPMFAILHDDPRYARAIREMGLAPPDPHPAP